MPLDGLDHGVEWCIKASKLAPFSRIRRGGPTGFPRRVVRSFPDAARVDRLCVPSKA